MRRWAIVATVAALGLGAGSKPVLQQPQPAADHGDVRADARHEAQPQNRAATDSAAPYQPKCQPAATREDAEYCEQRRAAEAGEDQARWALGQILLGLVGLVGVVGTLVYTARGINIARQALEVSERAYVSFEGIANFWHFNPETKTYWWSFEARWANKGSTPTRGLRVTSGMVISETDLPADFNDFGTGKPPEHTTVLAPGGTMVGQRIAITGEDLAAVRDGKKFIYLFGAAFYRDAFDRTPDRVTRFFCKVVLLGDPERKPTTQNAVAFSWPFHPRHNCADDECSGY
jgi:hypothetical protein